MDEGGLIKEGHTPEGMRSFVGRDVKALKQAKAQMVKASAEAKAKMNKASSGDVD